MSLVKIQVRKTDKFDEAHPYHRRVYKMTPNHPQFEAYKDRRFILIRILKKPHEYGNMFVGVVSEDYSGIGKATTTSIENSIKNKMWQWDD